MIEHLHDHIVEELKVNTRTDTVFVISAIFLDLILLAINTAIADEKDFLLMMIFILLIITVSIVSEIGLIKGKQTRTRLIEGLIEIYEDYDIAKYYSKNMLLNYQIRYNLFIITILATSLVAVIVPFLSLR